MMWTVQPLSTVAYEKPGGSNISLLIARSMGTYANVTVYFQVGPIRLVNEKLIAWCPLCREVLAVDYFVVFFVKF